VNYALLLSTLMRANIVTIRVPRLMSLNTLHSGTCAFLACSVCVLESRVKDPSIEASICYSTRSMRCWVWIFAALPCWKRSHLTSSGAPRIELRSVSLVGRPIPSQIAADAQTPTSIDTENGVSSPFNFLKFWPSSKGRRATEDIDVSEQ
jgi:hypothetical protein